MGGNNTSTTTSQPSNAALNTAATSLGNMLNTQLSSGYKGYTGDLSPSLSTQTTTGANALANNANNAAYGAGVTNAINQQAQIAAGNFGDDPTRQKLIDDVSTNTSAILQGSGRFGSGSHEDALIQNVGENLSQYDYARQQQAIQNLPTLYQSSQLPATAQLQAGQIYDAQALADAQEAERLFNVQNNAGWNTLAQGSSIFAGTAPASGTTTSTTTSTPWWQSAGSGLLGALSLFG